MFDSIRARPRCRGVAVESVGSGLQRAEVHDDTLGGQLAVVVEAVESDERQFHIAIRRGNSSEVTTKRLDGSE